MRAGRFRVQLYRWHAVAAQKRNSNALRAACRSQQQRRPESRIQAESDRPATALTCGARRGESTRGKGSAGDREESMLSPRKLVIVLASVDAAFVGLAAPQ